MADVQETRLCWEMFWYAGQNLAGYIKDLPDLLNLALVLGGISTLVHCNVYMPQSISGKEI